MKIHQTEKFKRFYGREGNLLAEEIVQKRGKKKSSTQGGR